MERRALYLYLSCELRLTRAEVRKLPGDICAPEDLLNLPDSFLDTLPPGLQHKLEQLPDTAAQLSAALREIEEALYIRHIRFLTAEDTDWPERFSTLEDPPLWLYLRGELPAEYTPTVAMIGSRSASFYGLRMADFIAAELAAKGVSIVSGLAAGIDSRAEEAAIEAGGKSFAVLGCGVNICYPKENYALFSKLCENGNGILSEFPPDTASRAWHFPDRNRLIAALGDCLCVLEAREQQSGSSITVGSALEQGKEIFCLPGRITDPLSRGCHVFIQNGANLLQSPQDILDYLGLRLRCMLTPRTRSVEALSPEEQHLYRLIREEACFLNRLLQRSGYDIGTVMRCLLKLELEGYIEQLSANYYSVC